jgi:small-conductance mechanosensitive channel
LAPRIDTEVDPQADQAIAERLREIYATLDGLGSVRVRVNAGVVVLEGEVATQELAAQAERLARQVEGVVEVADEVTIATGLERRITPAVARIVEGWRGFVRLLPVLAVAGGIFLVFVLLGRLLRRPRGLYRRIAPNPFLASLLAQIVQGAVLLAGAFAALLLLDATAVLGTLLGAAGILGLALGFALRDTVENYIASLLLSLRRPFGPKDFVRIADQEGIVLRLTSRATILLTLDGQQVRIPNAIVFKGVIVNYTEHTTRRFTFTLGIAPDADLAQAQQVAIDAVSSVPGVIPDPAPTAFFQQISESTVDLTVAGWLDQRTHDFFRTRSEAIRVTLTQVLEAGIDLPEPTVRLRRAAPAPQPGRKVQAEPTWEIEAQPTTRGRSLDEVLSRERERGRALLVEQAAKE